MENSDKKLVYSSDQYHQALIIQEMLAENNIEADIVNKKDSSFLIGDVEIYVDLADEEKAHSLIKQLS
jgi:hypothetical protein